MLKCPAPEIRQRISGISRPLESITCVPQPPEIWFDEFRNRDTRSFAAMTIAAGCVRLRWHSPAGLSSKRRPFPVYSDAAVLHPRRKGPAATGHPEGDSMATVELNHVWKQYGAVAAVQDFSLTTADGEFIVLVGPSGCGKTSTMRMIAGLETLTKGEIRFD